ncbi:MAG: hypothetical protein KY462_13710 [Actinobacteria bacterium]|nr:hypothetical protein [Actinomycetota bacterium]
MLDDEIVPEHERHSAITSQSIGVPELETLLDVVPADADEVAYGSAIVDDNVLGLKTATSREWRFKTLRRLYLLTPESVLFRALRDLWAGDPEAHPLLACSCAMTQDTVFRATAALVRDMPIGEEASSTDFIEPIEKQFPGAYQESTIATIAKKAYASWAQTGHFGEPSAGVRIRKRTTCCPENVAYALLIGHLEGARGEALFETLWTDILDHPRSHLFDLAFMASQRGMIEFRNAGGVVEVGFRQLLRPMEGQLL